jgi:hypothetical protein
MVVHRVQGRVGTRLRRAAVTFVLSGTMVLASVAAAQAHETSTTKSGDGSIARMDGTHQVTAVCDRDPDGHYAYIRETAYNGVVFNIYDNDGYGGNCGHDYSYNPNNFTTWLYAYNICVQAEGCGGPVYNWQF